MEKKTQANRTLGVSTPLGGDVLLLTAMSGSEHLGAMFQYELDLVSEDPNIDVNKLLGDNMTVRLLLTNGQTRYFNGYVSRFSLVGEAEGTPRYRATLVPWLWFLTRHADCRIFQEQAVPDIVKEVFRQRGFSDFEDGLTGSYRTWEYCVQYRETDFNFISRLMEQEGIYYYFKHENGKHTLVMCDSDSAHDSYPGYEKIRYYPPSGDAIRQEEHISDWSVDYQVQPGSYALNDFDFTKTKKALLTKSQVTRDHPAAESEIYDYPGEYTEYGDGENYAKARIEELQCGFEVARAAGNARGVACGYVFDLTDYPRDDQNRQHLITSVSYHLESDSFGSNTQGSGGATYSCTVTAIDVKQPFRPARATPKPSIQGPQTAIVVGKSGEEIWTDEYGRVKVKFHWDRYSKADENSSCWIRVAQVWAGKKWGSMYIPRIGHEVIVEFLEGDPDQPVITGRVYNGDAMPPYKLPANATMSTIKSNTSKGGGGFNEIRFEDKKGEEQIFIHAQKQMDIRVKASRYESIGGERHLNVEGDKKEMIKGNVHETLECKKATQIGETYSLTVTGDVSEKYEANHSEVTTGDVYVKGENIVIEGGTNVTIKVGGSSIAIESGGITIKTSGTMDVEGATTTVKGKDTTVDGSGSTTVSGGTVAIN